MKKLCLTFIILLLALAGFAQSNEKRIALVIGNSAYLKASLNNPVNDANLMAATLQDLGFTVIKRVNANRSQMAQAIAEFWSQLGSYNVALFFYAGHGVQVNGVNYLIPVDATLNTQDMVSFEAISVNDVVAKFEEYPDNTNIVILDACRNNPFRSWARGGNRGFKAMNPGSGTLIAFATSEGSTASDGEGTNGLFTEKLVKQIKKPVQIETVFKNTRVEVQKASGGNQSPQEWTKLTGDFYFIKLSGNLNNNENESIKDSKTQNMYGQLLDKRDQKYYKTIKIGNQVWMAENLDYNLLSTGFWAYDNDQRYAEKYGLLYNWEKAQNACPTGWRLPDKDDFKELLIYVGGEGKVAYPYLVNDGSSGFSAVLGGFRIETNFFGVGLVTGFWTSSTCSDSTKWFLGFSTDGYYTSFMDIEEFTGLSVRCLQDNIERSFGTIIIDSEIGGRLFIDNEYKTDLKSNSKGNMLSRIKTGSHILKIIGNDTWEQEITVDKDKTTYANAKVKKSRDLEHLFDSRDNKYYKTVKIGNQIWMAENLAFNTGVGNFAYDNDPGNVAKYGYIYYWETAKSACPAGWRIPTREEIIVLLENVGEEEITAENAQNYGKTSYNQLIQAGSSGFSALMAGRRFKDGSFANIGELAEFWTSSDSGDNEYACVLEISTFQYTAEPEALFQKKGGCSVRCLKDN